MKYILQVMVCLTVSKRDEGISFSLYTPFNYQSRFYLSPLEGSILITYMNMNNGKECEAKKL